MSETIRRKVKIISRSSRDFIREAFNTKDYSLADFFHGYVYARWPYHYIGIGRNTHPLTKFLIPLFKLWQRLFPPKPSSSLHDIDIPSNTIADGYHGKVTPLNSARQLVMVQEPIRVNDLEKVVPYVRARSILMQHPDHIAVIDCPCRLTSPNPCYPMDVCLVIGEPFASFVLEHHPHHSRKLTQDEAVQILEAEHERGHVHHVFFKDAMLGRYYAICNCCSCCCGAINAHRNGKPMLASSGYIAQLDVSSCSGCEYCIDFCQFDALSMDIGILSINEAKCMGCGVCVSHCPEDAISLVLAPEKGIPLDIDDLIEATNLSQRSEVDP